MKKLITGISLLMLTGCKSEKGADSYFQQHIISLSKDYLAYKKTHTDFDSYKNYHDSVLIKMRALTVQKRLDTVTAKVIKIEPILNESYEVTYQDGAFTYRARIRFRDDIDIKQSPFYKYKQSLSVGQVVTLQMYMLETASLGLENSPYNADLNMSEGSIEILVWPIPKGVTDIESQMQKDLYNTWTGNATSFK